jgi:hypothetical protein
MLPEFSLNSGRGITSRKVNVVVKSFSLTSEGINGTYQEDVCGPLSCIVPESTANRTFGPVIWYGD